MYAGIPNFSHTVVGGPDVVEVPVGQQHRRRRELGLVEELEQRLGGILTWVDDDTFLGIVLREDVAVGLKHPGRESCDEHL